jgi:hypothetical protein
VHGVSYSRALSWFIVPLLVITLGWKVAVRTGDHGQAAERDIQREAVNFLVRNHFTIIASEPMTEGRPTIHAIAGPCRVLVATTSWLGSDRDVLRSHATAADGVFVVFNGNTYAEQPTWLTVPSFLWARFRRELGLQAQTPTVLTVIASRSCDAERLPWKELR